MADLKRTQPLARDAMAYVLAGGRGSRLKELTDRRAKPAVYFGGKTRIIDFALSNALNSGIRRLGVAIQYKAHSLIRHLQRGWNFLRPERNESFDILPASQRVSETQWYEGTADAVYQNIDIIEDYAPKYMIILAGDHIYKMDYELMLQQHVNSGADVTVGCLEVPRKDASGFGVMAVDARDNITAFVEKPKDPQSNYAVTGLYFYDKDAPEIAASLKPSARGELEITDLNRAYLERGLLHVERFGRGYAWLDAGTHDSLLEASLFIQTVEKRQGLKIACPEEIAYRMAYIDRDQLALLADKMKATEYGRYLKRVATTDHFG